MIYLLGAAAPIILAVEMLWLSRTYKGGPPSERLLDLAIVAMLVLAAVVAVLAAPLVI